MTLWEAIPAATLLALAGAGHCLGMCGGISLSLSMAVPESSRRGYRLWGWQLLFASGRVCTYVLLGALAGGLGDGVLRVLPAAGPLAWLLAAVLMLMVALMLLGRDVGLARLENAGLWVWRRVQPLTVPLVPVQRASQALRLGLLWGLLPCGLLYTALALSVSTGTALNGAVVMLVFGLVTVPPVAAGGVATGLLSILRRSGWRRLAALMTLAMAVWLAWQGLAGAHHHHDHPAPAATESHSHHH